MKRRTYLVTVVTTVALSGCAGFPSPPTADGPETTPTAENVVPYRTLSDEGKEVFEAALETDSLVGPTSDFPADIWSAAYVEHKGTVYVIEREQTGNSIAEYSLHTEFVPETAVEDESEVIGFEESSPDSQDTFETARYEQRYVTRGQLPSQIVQYDYVRYEREYYELTRVVGDIPEWELSAVQTDA